MATWEETQAPPRRAVVGAHFSAHRHFTAALWFLPLGSLDAQTRLAMQQLLLAIWERVGVTVVFVNHDIASVGVGNRDVLARGILEYAVRAPPRYLGNGPAHLGLGVAARAEGSTEVGLTPAAEEPTAN